eukprot:4196219-Heterocapsa_arctica.AAC.1
MEEDVIMKYHETIIEEEIAVTMAQNRNFTEENIRVRQRASISSNEDLVRDVRQKPFLKQGQT